MLVLPGRTEESKERPYIDKIKTSGRSFSRSAIKCVGALSIQRGLSPQFIEFKGMSPSRSSLVFALNYHASEQTQLAPPVTAFKLNDISAVRAEGV